jgi:hypothetical protein
MTIALDQNRAKPTFAEVTGWYRLKTNKNWLAIWFTLPAAAFLILFLAYPLGLGVGCHSPMRGSAAMECLSDWKTTNFFGTI